MTVSIDIVIASYNGAEKLRRCLGSLIHQPDADELSIHIVLDGSTDDSDRVLEGLAVGSPGAFTVSRIEKGGLGKARNHGATMGSAEWLLFLDDDTELPHEFASGLSAALQATSADIIGLADEPLSSDGYFARSLRYLELASRRSFGQQLAVKGAAIGCRRTVFEELSGFDEARTYYQNEDIEFTQRALAAGKTAEYLTSPAIYHEAPTVEAYLRKSWQAMAAYNGVVSRHYYRVNYTLAFGSVVVLLAAAVIQDRRRLLPLTVAGSTAAGLGGAAVLRLSHASWRYLPGVIAAALLRLPFMALGTARYFWQQSRPPQEPPG